MQWGRERPCADADTCLCTGGCPCVCVQVKKRRIYDITNVLEGVGLLQKKSKNIVQRVGGLGGGINAEHQQEMDDLLDGNQALAVSSRKGHSVDMDFGGRNGVQQQQQGWMQHWHGFEEQGFAAGGSWGTSKRSHGLGCWVA